MIPSEDIPEDHPEGEKESAPDEGMDLSRSKLAGESSGTSEKEHATPDTEALDQDSEIGANSGPEIDADAETDAEPDAEPETVEDSGDLNGADAQEEAEGESKQEEEEEEPDCD